ncbi:ACP S-malonyltransferase [Actinomadura litoris]|nr:ACP S-malonyltransferase [Actinomadura litoris]
MTAASEAGPAPAGTGAPPPVMAMFPGQGSQRAGMAAHLVRDHPRTAGRVMAEADEALGLPLTRLCTTGETAELGRTEITQPAILATSLAVLEVLRAEAGFTPSAVAGHSLGEYAALVAAGVLGRADALRLVRVRGELMAGVGRTVAGAMVAVLGLPAARVAELCADAAADGVAEVANFNESDQTVVSGHRPAVDRVARRALDAGADRVARLDVSAPFHCSLMNGISEDFGAALDGAAFADPRTTVLSSVTGTALRDGAEARALLGRQLAGPVRWRGVLEAAHAAGVTAYVEVGPGRVLSGFANRAFPGSTVRSTNDARRVSALIRDLNDDERSTNR